MRKIKNSNNEALLETLRRCEHTGGWYGIKITSLSDRNSLDDTPLHTVCSWGELEPVKQIIAAGTDVNAKGDHGSTPLFNAVIGRNVEVVKFLLKSGANSKIKNDWNRTVLEYAKNISASKEIISILVA